MLDFIDSSPMSPASFENAPDPMNGLFDSGVVSLTGSATNFATHFRHVQIDLTDTAAPTLCIGLIDSYRFSQECLVKAFDHLQPCLAMLPFSNVRDCILRAGHPFDLIVYYSHGFEKDFMENVAALRQSFCNVPLVVLSDAEDAQQLAVIRDVLKQGAQGFIPTRTMGIPMIVAGIRFVQAGGTYAPIDLMLTTRPDPVRVTVPTVQPNRLTSRQIMVLDHLQQGKANKIIAHELGMSESTVKVHVRNIMRKMGATNRTQAAYKAKSFCQGSALQS